MTQSVLRTGGLARRSFLISGAALVGAALLPRRARADDPPLQLIAAENNVQLLPSPAAPSPLWTYGPQWPLIVRTERGKPFHARLTNKLSDHTAIHWHGIRLPNAMDGVPYVTQPPVKAGETFDYIFTPPDAGTFFFHPHCDTITQLGRGLAGVLIVEEPGDAELFDADVVVVIKDWRLKPDGSFDTLTTDQGAGKAGTFGTRKTVNGLDHADFTVRPGARVRLRVLNVDVTRIVTLAVDGAPAALIATDGNPLDPLPLTPWRLGPAMRADITFDMPREENATVDLSNVWGMTPELLARFHASGEPLPARTDGPPRLTPNAIPQPDIANAERLRVDMSASPASPQLEAWLKETGAPLDAVCRTGRIFWALNRTPWPGQSHEKLPPPLFNLTRGRSYIFEFANATPHPHPMHLHGHTFQVVASSKEKIVPHLADTVLVAPKERIDVAFVADNPGDWMVHCHIVEHQETGMMGYVRVA